MKISFYFQGFHRPFINYRIGRTFNMIVMVKKVTRVWQYPQILDYCVTTDSQRGGSLAAVTIVVWCCLSAGGLLIVGCLKVRAVSLGVTFTATVRLWLSRWADGQVGETPWSKRCRRHRSWHRSLSFCVPPLWFGRQAPWCLPTYSDPTDCHPRSCRRTPFRSFLSVVQLTSLDVGFLRSLHLSFCKKRQSIAQRGAIEAQWQTNRPNAKWSRLFRGRCCLMLRCGECGRPGRARKNLRGRTAGYI